MSATGPTVCSLQKLPYYPASPAALVLHLHFSSGPLLFLRRLKWCPAWIPNPLSRSPILKTFVRYSAATPFQALNECLPKVLVLKDMLSTQTNIIESVISFALSCSLLVRPRTLGNVVLRKASGKTGCEPIGWLEIKDRLTALR